MDRQRTMCKYTKTLRDGSSSQSFQPFDSLALPGVLFVCLPHESEVHQQDKYQYIHQYRVNSTIARSVLAQSWYHHSNNTTCI